MTDFLFANNVDTTLASPITSGATTIVLSSAANLPTLAPGETFALTLNDAATQTVFEIVYVPYGGISGATLTGCIRGREGTTAQSWLAGDYAYGGITAGFLNSALQSNPFSGSSLTNPGYLEYANGVKDQFGTSAAIAGQGSVTIAFPVAFTTEIFAVTLGVDDSGVTAWEAKYSATLTDLTIYLYGGPSSSSAPVSWRAIGI